MLGLGFFRLGLGIGITVTVATLLLLSPLHPLLDEFLDLLGDTHHLALLCHCHSRELIVTEDSGIITVARLCIGLSDPAIIRSEDSLAHIKFVIVFNRETHLSEMLDEGFLLSGSGSDASLKIDCGSTSSQEGSSSSKFHCGCLGGLKICFVESVL